jgi:hypothetical protein
MVYRLDLSIRVQPVRPQFPPYPAHLEPSERRLNVDQRVTVDPYRTRLERVRHSHGLFRVGREYGRG